MQLRLCVLLLASLFMLPLFSQETTPLSEDTNFRFIYRNDFFTATDYYYTQGIRIELSNEWVSKLPTKYLLPSLQNADYQRHTFYIRQDGYTPTSIRSDTILTGNRPFSATLRIGHQQITKQRDKGLRLLTEFDAGVIGPLAFGGEEQVFIHRVTGNKEPLGWQHQIANDVVLNYALELDKSIIRTSFLSANIGGNATVGTLINQVGIQSDWKLGLIKAETATQPHKRFVEAYLFANGRVNAVAYNGFMQGGFFNKNSPYTIPAEDIKRLVYRYEYGIDLHFRQLEVRYSYTNISLEFANSLKHAWGNCQIWIWF